MKVGKKILKSVSKYTPSTILSFGHYDINYSITLSEEDILKYHIDNLADLTKYEDISFIVDNQYLWNKIQMETSNNSINLLLYLNKISFDSTKTYIEYIAYEEPVYYNSSVKQMLTTVNDFNFFFVNKNALIPDKKKYFSLKIKYKNQETIFKFDSVEDEEEKNRNKDNLIQEEGTSEEKPVEKKSENLEMENEENPFNRIALDCNQFNYFICSLRETLEINPYKDFIDFVVHIKLKYGALITIEYGDVSEDFTDKDSMTLLNKLYLITDIFLFDEKDTLNNFKKHYEIFTKENSKKKYKFDDNKSQENNIEQNKDKTSDSNSQENKEEQDKRSNYKVNNEDKKSQMSSQININDLILKLNNVNRFSSARRAKEMSEKDMFEYFKKTIACNGALSILNSKLGIFLDSNFSKVTFIEVPMNIKGTLLTYDIKPYPKLTHTTVDLVELYKGCLRQKRDFFKNIFYAGILNKIFYVKRKNFGMDVLYSGYLTGHTILKRLLDLVKREIPFPDNSKFYIVKISNNEVNEYVKNEINNKKENKFVLDCTNLEKSKLKNYVPLFDYNLHEFFENKSIQRELANKGFINSKGFVNYDPYYRKGMGVPKKKNMRYSSADHLIKKQVEVNVKNMKKRILQNPVTTKVKLPVIQCRVTEKINNYEKYYGRRCSHDYNQKCDYCDLYQRAKIEIDVENEKRKQMQLRRYK